MNTDIDTKTDAGQDDSDSFIYITGANYELGEIDRSADSIADLDTTLVDMGLPDDLDALGLCYFRETSRSIWEMAAISAKRSIAIADMNVSEIDMLVMCSTTFTGDTAQHADGVAHVLQSIGRSELFPIGVSVNRCASFLSGICMAEALVASNRFSSVLVVTADKFTDDKDRLTSFALFSDSAASCVVTRKPVTSSYQILATARAADSDSMKEGGSIAAVLGKKTAAILNSNVGLNGEQAKAVLPMNVYQPVVWMSETQAGAQPEQLYLKNIPRYGHCFAADPLINLVDFERSRQLADGENVKMVASVPGLRVECLVKYNAACESAA